MNNQKMWDECLLHGWYGNYSFGWVAHRYMTLIGSSDVYCMDTLKRHPHTGIWYSVPVRAVFRENWPRLNDLLWDQMITEPRAIAALAKRKWTKEFPSAVMRARRKARSGTVRLTIGVRDRDRRHDWHTVK